MIPVELSYDDELPVDNFESKQETSDGDMTSASERQSSTLLSERRVSKCSVDDIEIDIDSDSMSDDEEYLADSFLRQVNSVDALNVPESPRPTTDSPIFHKYLTDSPTSNLKKCVSSVELTDIHLENPKKIKVDEIFAAKLAHEKILLQPKIYEPLILISKRLQKDKEISILGNFFKKVLSWTMEPSEKEKIDVLSDISDSEGPIVKTSEDIENSNRKESFVQMGLVRNSVIQLELLDLKLRKQAQETIVKKKNVAFIDKVQVLYVPLRKHISKRVRSRMFYTREQFVQMIANNIRQMEAEVRRKQRKQRKQKSLRPTNSS